MQNLILLTIIISSLIIGLVIGVRLKNKQKPFKDHNKGE